MKSKLHWTNIDSEVEKAMYEAYRQGAREVTLHLSGLPGRVEISDDDCNSTWRNLRPTFKEMRQDIIGGCFTKPAEVAEGWAKYLEREARAFRRIAREAKEGEAHAD